MAYALRIETLDAELIRSQVHSQRFLIEPKLVVAINASNHHEFESWAVTAVVTSSDAIVSNGREAQLFWMLQ